MLADGADIESKSRTGATPLHAAAAVGGAEAVEMLLEANAAADSADVSGWTAMHHAAASNQLGVLELLLKHGAPVDAVDAKGWTPLHTAAVHGHADVVSRLLAAGAQARTRSPADSGPPAGGSGSNAPVPVTHTRRSPLFLAASAGHSSVVRVLLDNGYGGDKQTQTAALAAAIRNHHGGVVDEFVYTDAQ